MMKLDHILEVFSTLGDRIELISVWEGQASWDTSLSTQQQCNQSNLKIKVCYELTTLEEPLQIFEKF